MSGLPEARARQALGLLERDGVDVLLLFPGVNIGYYTGFKIGLSERLAAAIIPVHGEPYFVVNQLEGELRGLKPWFRRTETWLEHEDPFRLLAETLKRGGYGSAALGVPEEAPWGWVNKLREHLPAARFVDVGKRLGYVRMVKTADELASIAEACRVSDEAMQDAFSGLHTGMTELELERLMVTGMQEAGAERAFADVLFGERAALPHGGASKRKLKPGEFVLVDMGCTVDGYWSDCTRTVMYREPTKRQSEVYDVVLRANRVALEAVKPGATCESVDVAARNVIEEAGYGPYFIHRLGHGVGLEIHEHPYIVRNNRRRLEPNMVFSDEPGIYIMGEMGVRVEDTVVCTEKGGRCLTGFPRELVTYPVK